MQDTSKTCSGHIQDMWEVRFQTCANFALHLSCTVYVQHKKIYMHDQGIFQSIKMLAKVMVFVSLVSQSKAIFYWVWKVQVVSFSWPFAPLFFSTQYKEEKVAWLWEIQGFTGHWKWAANYDKELTKVFKIKLKSS